MKTGAEVRAKDTPIAGVPAPVAADAQAQSGPLVIEPAQAADAPAISRLLRDAGLPHDDFAPHLAHFLVARIDGNVVGAIGAEVCGEDALLRSFAVTPACRGAGVGDQLLHGLETAAGVWNVKRWWLLTTTAERYFVQRGFRAMQRADAPPAIAATTQFRGLCPSVARCLSRERRTP